MKQCDKIVLFMEMGTVPISTYISVNDAIQKYILKS